MIDPDVVREVLEVARSRGAGFAELYAEERSSTVMRLDDGRVEEVVAGGDRGAGIRVFHGESQAYAYTNRLDAASLREAAVAAASAGQGGDVGTTVAALAATPVVRQPVRIAGADVPCDRKVGWLREADEAARAFDPAVRQVLVAYLESLQHVLVANSDGRWSEEERPRIRLVAQVVASRDDVLQTGFDGPGGLAGLEFIESHPPAAVAETAARMAVAMLGGRPAPAGQMPVVLGPGGGGILFHEACGHGLEVDHVQKDASVFKGRLGETFASPLVNGVDDGTVPAEWGTNAFDDEGTPTQRTVLFEKGTLVGHAVRRGARAPRRRALHRERPAAVLRVPADPADDELVDPAGRFVARGGRVATPAAGCTRKALGGGQVNPATGDFVFGVAEGYLIENGELTTPVRGANLIGNGPQILAGIDAVADDYEFRHGICGKEGQGVPVANGSPTLRIARDDGGRDGCLSSPTCAPGRSTQAKAGEEIEAFAEERPAGAGARPWRRGRVADVRPRRAAWGACGRRRARGIRVRGRSVARTRWRRWSRAPGRAPRSRSRRRQRPARALAGRGDAGDVPRGARARPGRAEGRAGARGSTRGHRREPRGAQGRVAPGSPTRSPAPPSRRRAGDRWSSREPTAGCRCRRSRRATARRRADSTSRWRASSDELDWEEAARRGRRARGAAAGRREAAQRAVAGGAGPGGRDGVPLGCWRARCRARPSSRAGRRSRRSWARRSGAGR